MIEDLDDGIQSARESKAGDNVFAQGDEEYEEDQENHIVAEDVDQPGMESPDA